MTPSPWADLDRHTALLKRREQLRDLARTGPLSMAEQLELAETTRTIQQIEQAQAQEAHP